MVESAESLAAQLRSGHRSVSFEFFPPKDDEGEELLWRSIAELEEVLAERLAVLHEQQHAVKAQLKADAKARKKSA